MCRFFQALLLTLILYSCKAPSGVFSKKTAHENYGDKLDKSGLKQTALGGSWFEVAQKAISASIPVQLPYKENGYFSADQPGATGLRFDAKRGEQLTIELSKVPTGSHLLFADLFSYLNGDTKFIQSVDTLSNQLQYVVKENTGFILRLQPELLQSLSYTILVRTGPSLAFPVGPPTSKNRVISVWGDGRDRGARKHEGVDIGGALRTPLIAVGDGYVSRVTENNLGGKVIFINDDNSNNTWYYAHLDSQIATNGQRVKKGDIIGLMGNTGNARTTAPHLHFGIYNSGGAIDPLPFINTINRDPKPVIAPLASLGKRMRINGKSSSLYFYPGGNTKEKAIENTPLLIIGAVDNLYKAVLPGGETRFIPAVNVAPIDKKIKQLILTKDVPLLDAPIDGSPVIQTLAAGSGIDLLGVYGPFQYVSPGGRAGWIRQQ